MIQFSTQIEKLLFERFHQQDHQSHIHSVRRYLLMVCLHLDLDKPNVGLNMIHE